MATGDGALPLAGLKVVDFSQVFAGPGTTMYLADQGADVVKVEPPNAKRDKPSGSYLAYNRAKRSLVLDLRSPEGNAVALDLIRGADVMVVAWPPGQAERLGLGYEAASALNQRLVYASITGWGERGPDRTKIGFDLLVQAYSGIMASQPARDGTPLATAWYPADMSIPMYMAYAITLALLQREKTGFGQRIDTSQLQAQLAMQFIHFVYSDSGPVDVDRSMSWSWRRPQHTYRAQDGGYLVVHSLGRAGWRTLWATLGLADFPDDPRMEGVRWPPDLIDTVYPIVAAKFLTASRDIWLERLKAAALGSVSSPVLSRDEVMRSAQVAENGMILEQTEPTLGTIRMLSAPFSLSQSPPASPRLAPGVGEHTDEILSALGYSPERIRALREKGVVK